MNATSTKFGGMEYVNGNPVGYRFTPGSDEDPAVIASKITDWSNVTDPMICWRNPLLKQPLTTENWDAYNAAQARCTGQSYTPYFGPGGAYEAGLTPGVSGGGGSSVAYIGNTPVSQMTNLSPATAALLGNTTPTPAANNSTSNNLVSNLTASLPAPIANVVNNVTSNPLLLLAVIGVGIYLAKKK